MSIHPLHDHPQPFYIAGQMSWIEKFNFPAFDNAANNLRTLGFEVISPAELDDIEIRQAAMASKDGNPLRIPNGETWADFLARDVKLIADKVGTLIMLPNWNKSRGARLEAFVASLCDKHCYEYQTWHLISTIQIVHSLHFAMVPAESER